MSIRLVILDWAGTAVDYGCFAPVNAFSLAFNSCGIEPTTDEIRGPMGMLKRDHIRTMLSIPRLNKQWTEKYGTAPDDAAVEKVYSVFESSLMKSLSDYATPKPGTVETVNKLHERGLYIGSTTGYTDAMMAVVTESAEKQGYKPDAWFSPDAVRGFGRPYPYMIYKNMYQFGISSVSEVIKVGDTVADIKEGKHAGVMSLGVLEGSSVLGLSEEEYSKMPVTKKESELCAARKILLDAGADDVLLNLAELPAWISENC